MNSKSHFPYDKLYEQALKRERKKSKTSGLPEKQKKDMFMWRSLTMTYMQRNRDTHWVENQSRNIKDKELEKERKGSQGS